MTEPSEAAKLKARELYRDIWPDSASYQHDYTSARRWSATLARVLQEQSDVAKYVDDGMEAAGIHPTALTRTKLHSLILDDEPKTFTIKMVMTRDEQLRAISRALDEGKMIKIVEATDD